MHLTDVVLPTLAVAASWLVIGLLLAGCGCGIRRSLLRLLGASSPRALGRADLWVGFAGLLAFLQLWSLFGGITWATAIAPIAVGAVGVLIGRSAFASLPRTRRALAAGVPAALAVLWLSDRALGTPTDYDFGLYHLGVIQYSSSYAVIPGLGDLQSRLGAGDAHFLFVALLGRGPWGTAGFQLANGLLVSMLLVDIASRFAGSRAANRASSFTTRMALLLVPATLVTVGSGPNYRLSSPNLDLATFVLVVAGALYLAEAVERDFAPVPVLAALGAFAAAAATRPLFWLPMVIAALIVTVGAARRSPATTRRHVGFALVVGVLPLAVAAGWLVRQSILTGYPFYPLTEIRLPVDWRMPAATVKEMDRVVDAWARHPREAPVRVLASWHWFRPWLLSHATDPDILAPILLLAALPAALASRSPFADGVRRAQLLPAAAVVLCSAPSVGVWFLTAPDPRFALGPIWLVPVALVAWSLPPVGADELRASGKALVYSAGAGVLVVLIVAEALTTSNVYAPTYAVVAGLIALAAQQVARRTRRLGVPANLVEHVVCTVIGLTFVGDVAHLGAFHPIVADGPGPLGTQRVPKPALASFVTTSGLLLTRPVKGTDRCFRVLLCTSSPNPLLRLRGSGIGDGFTVAAKG